MEDRRTTRPLRPDHAQIYAVVRMKSMSMSLMMMMMMMKKMKKKNRMLHPARIPTDICVDKQD
jgi:hypothetical protein